MPEEVLVTDPATPAAPVVTPNASDPTRPGAASTPVEDPRIKGMIADLQKERSARQAAEARHKEFETQLETERKRVQVLAGVNPKSKEEVDTEEVKAAFAKLFPHLANLTEEQIKKVLSVADRGDELTATTTKYWENHGRKMLATVHSSIADELGGGDLTPRQRKSITDAYIAEAASDPEFLKRHEAGDDTLIAEFVKNFMEDWGGPIKRSITATAVGQNRPVPNGRGRNVQGTPQKKKIDFNDPKAVADAMVESYTGHGGTFGDKA